MFRWIPSCNRTCGHSKSLSSLHVARRLGKGFTTASFSPPRSSHGLDFHLLFRSCNDIQSAKRIHARFVVLGRAASLSMYISTTLISLYGRLGYVSYALATFNNMPTKDISACNCLVLAYVHSGYFFAALNCFNRIFLASSLKPDSYTFPPVLKSCTNFLEAAKIHCLVAKLGYMYHIVVAASLLHCFCRLDTTMNVAHKLFDEMLVRDVSCWNAIVSGFSRNGNATEAFTVLDRMRLDGIKMNGFTLSYVLPLCAQFEMLSTGMVIHLNAIKYGLESDLYVSNGLIHMYGKVGSFKDSKKVFDKMEVRDDVSWNTMIAVCEQHDKPVAALQFYLMMQEYGFQFNKLTLLSLASIVVQSRDCQNAKSLHGFVSRRIHLAEDVTMQNSVMNMYMKFGDVESAHRVFDQIPFKDVISWNTLITGYTQNCFSREAIQVFLTMHDHKQITPNLMTWVNILPAYSHIGALRHGMKIHGRLLKDCLNSDPFVLTCLLDMYGKCGKLDDALSLFYQSQHWCFTPTWNAMIACLGIHGDGVNAMKVFRNMIDYGVKPSDVTFLSLLSACSHSGLIDDGRYIFRAMKDEYGIEPGLKHYGCMVDLLGRGGYFGDTLELIRNMPLKADMSIWGTLLGACRIHGNVELGQFASTRLLEDSSDDSGFNILLSNIFATTGKWDEACRLRLRSIGRSKGLKKIRGWSSIEVRCRVHVFYPGGDRSHPDCEELYKELRGLTIKMKSLGYVPDHGFVLQDVEDDEKEQILMCHSERLAIAFGVISNRASKNPLWIFKNLRVCGDCHNAIKYLSRITGREILVRDYRRFHLFKDGVCSCGDYW